MIIHHHGLGESMMNKERHSVWLGLLRPPLVSRPHAIARNLGTKSLCRVWVGYDGPPLDAQQRCSAWRDTLHTPARLACVASFPRANHIIQSQVGQGDRSRTACGKARPKSRIRARTPYEYGDQ